MSKNQGIPPKPISEAVVWKKKYQVLLVKHKEIVNLLKQKIEMLSRGEKEITERYRREIDDLRHQVDFERSQKMNIQSQMIQDSKVKMPNLDFDSLAQNGGASSEQMMKFREALESQLKSYSEMLATAEARAAKNDLEISKKEKLNQKISHQLKKVEERNKELQTEANRVTGSLKQIQALFDETKKELEAKDNQHREISNKKEDEIIDLKKEVRERINMIEDLEHQVHAFDTIKIAMEVSDVVKRANEVKDSADPDKMLAVMEDLKRIRYEMRKFDRTVEQKFVNLSNELDYAELLIKKQLIDEYAA